MDQHLCVGEGSSADLAGGAERGEARVQRPQLREDRHITIAEANGSVPTGYVKSDRVRTFWGTRVPELGGDGSEGCHISTSDDLGRIVRAKVRNLRRTQGTTMAEWQSTLILIYVCREYCTSHQSQGQERESSKTGFCFSVPRTIFLAAGADVAALGRGSPHICSPTATLTRAGNPTDQKSLLASILGLTAKDLAAAFTAWGLF